jgi:hypothetical protein
MNLYLFDFHFAVLIDLKYTLSFFNNLCIDLAHDSLLEKNFFTALIFIMH